jgi:hypothetical protein
MKPSRMALLQHFTLRTGITFTGGLGCLGFGATDCLEI